MDQENSDNFQGRGGMMREIFHDLHDAVVQLRSLARTSADVVAGVELWRKALDAAKRLSEFGPNEGDNACLDQLSLGLEELESSARAFFRDTDAEEKEIARRCAVLRAVSRLLLRMTRELEEKEPRDETPFLIQELRDIDQALDGGPLDEVDDDNGEEVVRDENALIRQSREAIQDLEKTVLEVQAQHQLSGAREIESCDSENAYRVFRLSRSLATTAGDLLLGKKSEKDNGLEEIAANLEKESVRLRDLFVHFMETSTEESGFEISFECCRWITGEMDQARVASYEDHSQSHIDKLKRLEADGEIFARGMRTLAGRIESLSSPETRAHNRSIAKRTSKKLSRMVRWIGNVIADRILANRLDSSFGPRQVRRWEKMIFWLIMVVMLLIVIDHFGGQEVASPEAQTTKTTEVSGDEDDWDAVSNHLVQHLEWTTWVDTFICLVLLWDFLVRLVLSPARLKYFKRHFITEFLPSLPFGLLQGIMAVDNLRFVRTARLVRVARFLRVLRPLIRVSRLFLFLARAADRLVERNSWFLNQNIVFSTESEQSEAAPTLLSRARNIDSWISQKTSTVMSNLKVGAQVEGAEWRMGLIEAEFAFHDGGVRAASVKRRHSDDLVKDLDVDVVVESLRGLDDNQVAEIVGVDIARQLTASLSFFRLPVLRRFAFARFLVGPTGAPDPLWTTARLGRLAGDLLALVARLIHWFSDLYGTITGAQFLDRVGMQLVKATIRPAKRLVMFVVAIFFILGMVWLTQVPELMSSADSLYGLLIGPVSILGLVCFIPLGFGIWLRRIAGQAVDFFDRVSEAQFFALTEIVKEKNTVRDVGFLVDRVLLPEHMLLADDESESAQNEARRLLTSACLKDGQFDPEEVPLPWSMCDAMMLYYRDFIDGAYFHKNDTKIANILVGNLTLENIRRNRLNFDAKSMRRLEALDIGRNKGGFVGPRVWFNFITHSVAQHTARLLIEYNQNCIPVAEYPAAHAEDRRIFDAWLARRQRISRARRRNELLTADEVKSVDSGGGTLIYRTTEFNALNFLTKEEDRDQAVRERFGDQVADLLDEDRINLIRDIFGTFPMHELPKEKRTFNPYRFYRRYLARGRVFAFPLISVWLVMKGVRFFVRRVIAIVKDVLNPNDRPIKVSAGRSGFEVARRKIYRMRRPVVMEAVRIRALFDLEYLGISIPGTERETVRPQDYLVEDLRLLDASERDWEEFREIKTEREQQMRLLVRFLRDRSKAGSDLLADVAQKNPSRIGKEAQTLRVIATAFVCNHGDSFAVLNAIDILTDLLDRLPKEKKKRRWAKAAKTLVKVRACWSAISPKDCGESMPEILAIALDGEHRSLRHHLRLLSQIVADGNDPMQYVHDALAGAGERPSSWCEQTIAVRTVQSLGMLDLQGYEAIIRELGGYEPAPEKSSHGNNGRRL